MTSTSIEAPCYISPEVFAGEPHSEKVFLDFLLLYNLTKYLKTCAVTLRKFL